MKDYLLIEEEFIRNQEVFKPKKEKDEEDVGAIGQILQKALLKRTGVTLTGEESSVGRSGEKKTSVKQSPVKQESHVSQTPSTKGKPVRVTLLDSDSD